MIYDILYVFYIVTSMYYNTCWVINMNWIKKNKEELLHHNMAFIGGITGIYAITVRGGNFGGAQTSNLIELVFDFVSQDLFGFFVRILVLLVYAVSLVAAYLISTRFPGYKKYICLIVESVCGLLAGLIPAEVNPLLALCPIFTLSAFQWQIFTESKHYNSSTLFSTNNLKQMLLSWTNYTMHGDSEQKRKAFFFMRTLLTFHIGVVAGLFAVKFWNEKGIWFALLPMASALYIYLLMEVKNQNSIILENQSENCN